MTVAIYLGHDLEILERIAGGTRLRLVRRFAAAMADGNGQRGQLDEILLQTRVRLLFDAHVGHLELVLESDRMQELYVIDAFIIQAR